MRFLEERRGMRRTDYVQRIIIVLLCMEAFVGYVGLLEEGCICCRSCDLRYTSPRREGSVPLAPAILGGTGRTTMKRRHQNIYLSWDCAQRYTFENCGDGIEEIQDSPAWYRLLLLLIPPRISTARTKQTNICP